jgi:hypothetical protein
MVRFVTVLILLLPTCGPLVVLVGLAEDQLVRPAPERVAVDGARVEVDVRVAAFRLAGRASVKVPDGQL